MNTENGQIRIGTSGWSYPKGKGTWNGVFYPPGMSSKDELRYYSQRFNTVEINSTFTDPRQLVMSGTGLRKPLWTLSSL